MTYSAKDVAGWMVAAFQRRHQEITNLKLQKILYYAQAWHLVFYDRPLFRESIEAWIHGPVIPSVFRDYRRYGWKPISEPFTLSRTPEQVRPHLKEVIRVYGDFDALSLERLTHQESPWREVRKGLAPDEPSNRVITNESMRKYYSARLNG